MSVSESQDFPVHFARDVINDSKWSEPDGTADLLAQVQQAVSGPTDRSTPRRPTATDEDVPMTPSPRRPGGPDQHVPVSFDDMVPTEEIELTEQQIRLRLMELQLSAATILPTDYSSTIQAAWAAHVASRRTAADRHAELRSAASSIRAIINRLSGICAFDPFWCCAVRAPGLFLINPFGFVVPVWLGVGMEHSRRCILATNNSRADSPRL